MSITAYFGKVSVRWTLATLCAVLAVLPVLQVASAVTPAATDDDKLVTVYDQNVEQTFITRAATVAQALKDGDLTLSEGDAVEPGIDAKIEAKSYHINIYRARPVLVVDGNSRVKIATAEQSPAKIVAATGGVLYPEDATHYERIDSSNVLDEGGAGLKLVIDRATALNFTLYGKSFTARTQATTVGAMLKEKGVTLGAKDGSSHDMGAAIVSGMNLSVWRNGVQTVTQEESIAFAVDTIQDKDKELGYRAVQTPGVAGKRQVTYEINMQNGVEVGRREIQSVTTLAPVKQVEVKGAKVLGAYTTPTQNESITWDYLIARGFTREQTAGIMGNLKQEHGFNTTGDGLAQWTGGRKAALMAMPDPYNIHTQLDFMMSELNGRYAGVQAAIKATNSVTDATIIFQNRYEGCGICVQDRRIQYAYNILASH